MGNQGEGMENNLKFNLKGGKLVKLGNNGEAIKIIWRDRITLSNFKIGHNGKTTNGKNN